MPRELARTIAQTMVITPTHITNATLIFSSRDIWRFHKRRTGIAITVLLAALLLNI
jgi:hypothetical protein